MALRDLYNRLKDELDAGKKGTVAQRFWASELPNVGSKVRKGLEIQPGSVRMDPFSLGQAGTKMLGSGLVSLYDAGKSIGKGAFDYAMEEARNPSKSLGESFRRLTPQMARGFLTGLKVQGAANPTNASFMGGISTLLSSPKVENGKLKFDVGAGLSETQKNMDYLLAMGGLTQATNPLFEGIARGVGATKYIPRNTIVGTGNVAEDYTLEKLKQFAGEGDGKLSAQQVATSFLSPFVIDAFRVAGGKAVSPLTRKTEKMTQEVMQDERGIFAGPNAVNWNKLSNKFSSLIDQKPRAEISDINAYLKGGTVKKIQANVGRLVKQGETPVLADIFEHKTLYNNYPQLKTLKVNLDPNYATDLTRGSYDPATNSITMNPKLSRADFRGSLLHEIQHAVQEIEGFARGANLDTPDYKKFGGEIEANSVKARESFPSEKRTGIDPYSPTMAKNNIRKEDIIVDYGSGKNFDIEKSSKEMVSQIGKGTEERGFAESVKESSNIPEGLKQELNNVDTTYNPITNKETQRVATEAVTKDYLQAYNRAIKDDGVFSAESIAEGQLLMADLARQGNAEAAAEVAYALMKKGTKAGQAVQAFSLLDKLTPEGMLIYAQKSIDDANKSMGVLDRLFNRKPVALDPDSARTILDIMYKVRDMPEGRERTQLIRAAIEVINQKIPYSANEMIDAYRYEGMLSNPRTQLRNIIGNMTQTFITRPATMAAEVPYDWMRSVLTGEPRQRYISDVPDYYKNALNSIPLAAQSFMETMRGNVNIDKPDLGQLRRAGLAGPVSKFMEGMDRFNQTIIGSAVYADLVSKGIDERAAADQAELVARRMLFRTRPDPSNTTGQGFLNSKIDALSKGVSNLPGRKWAMPFIQTPMNVAKQWLEFSPAGIANLPGNARPTEQLAKTSLGSIAMLIGFKLAAEGKTSWVAPTDQEQKQVYYATGRKPMSVKIGDTWVPMTYFGPLSFALAIPAAFEYWDKNSNKSLTKTDSQKAIDAVLDLYQTLTDQTFMSGFNNYVQILSGDADYNLPSSVGYTATQLIPYTGLINYVNSIIDPTIRKKTGFKESFVSGIPFLSQQNPPYLEPGGVPSKRDPINYVLPWDVGISDPKFEKQYETNNYINQVAPLKSWRSRYKSVYTDYAKGLISKQERDSKLESLDRELNLMQENYKGINK